MEKSTLKTLSQLESQLRYVSEWIESYIGYRLTANDINNRKILEKEQGELRDKITIARGVVRA